MREKAYKYVKAVRYLSLMLALSLLACESPEGLKNENMQLRKKVEELDMLVQGLKQENQSLKSEVNRLENIVKSQQVGTATDSKKQEEQQKPDTLKVGAWQGSGMKNTAPFTITKSPWIILWANRPTFAGAGILQISVNKINGTSVSLAANTMQEENDSSYIYESGTFYLEISAANTNWTIEVHQAR